jgi:ABC-type transport system substrate-binding protein
MRARFPAALAAILLVASACNATASPSPSTAPPTGSSTAAPPSVAPSADAKTVLRVARISDFLPSIHPVDLGTGNQELMADIVFSTLVDVDSDEVTILPDLATEWTASPDATVYTFKLNPAAVWSDGTPVTADDVEYTIAWSAQNPTAFKQIPVDMWVNVKGGDAVAGTKNIPEGIKKVDANTVEITLKAPDATFLRRIAGAVYYILPKHKLADLTAEAALTCPFCLGTVGETIGSGPYDFSESISAGGATFTAKKNRRPRAPGSPTRRA